MSIPRHPAPGEIWLARLDPVEGHEQAGNRPVLVISGSRYNRLQERLRIILPLTTRDRDLPFQIRIDPPAGGVRAPSFIITEQPRTIATSRFRDYWGVAPPEVMEECLLWLRDFLDPR